ncbi:MAG: shikimate kinase [Candidatus Marinimicrobia bacterium]|nr:shikimate kinase [Candidatus Neomarinimicrobiota bacterium]
MDRFANTNIFLIGMMGSGKSTVGRLLAKKLSLLFIDLDLEIEDGEGLTIADIFNKDGAERFRQLESEYLKNVIQHTGQVIATGGGIILDHDNRQRIISNGVAILLRCQMKTLSNRLKNIHSRPLLRKEGTTLQTLENIWTERQEFYHSIAQIVLDNDLMNPTTAVNKIIKQTKGTHGNNQG